ncbi:MAG: hypothetical protein E7450_06350 [Ruminococcaceae bacterium]|nr:hypothetical protein [Oscillospiraceae bacterium]
MKPDALQESMAQFLRDNEIPAVASWPRGCRQGPGEAVVLVGLDKLECQPVGLQDYLGQRLDEETGRVVEWYGRKAALEFALDILAPAEVGAQACRQLLQRLVQVLHSKRPNGLTVRKLTAKEIEFDQKEGLLRLECAISCEGWVWASGDEAADILDFTLRGDWNG